MLRTMVPALGVFAAALITGCSAGGSDTGANARGGSSSAGTGGALGGPAGGGGGLGGTPVNSGGSGGTVSSGGSGGVAGTSAAGAGGAAGAVGSAGTAGTSSGAAPLFSDDFEAATINSKWTAHINGASFNLDTTQKHGGNQSVHVKQTGFSSMLAAEGAPIFPAPNNHFYARLWLRVAAATGGGLGTAHVVWFETGDVSNDTHEVRVGANLGYFQSNLYFQGEVDIRDPAAAMTTDAWHCIQAEYGNDLLDVKLDGVHSSISTTTWVAAESANGGNMQVKTNWAPTYAAFRIGWELGSGEIWFDDVALDHVPVPCN